MRTGLASIFNVMEPVIRVHSIRNDGRVILAFNNDVIMPYDFEEQVRQDQECQRAAADPSVNEKVSNFSINELFQSLSLSIPQFSTYFYKLLYVYS